MSGAAQTARPIPQTPIVLTAAVGAAVLVAVLAFGAVVGLANGGGVVDRPTRADPALIDAGRAWQLERMQQTQRDALGDAGLGWERQRHQQTPGQ